MLNSSDISEEVTGIEWLNNGHCQKPLMLTQNDRTIKLWRLQDKTKKTHESAKKLLNKGKGIIFPKTKTQVEGKSSKLLKTFKTGKEFHLHSLSQSADTENFLAADEFGINLYNLESASSIFNMVDFERIKDRSLQESITCARFNQNQGTVFLYGTTQGKVNVCDFRENSDFHKTASTVLDAAQKNAATKAGVFNKWTNAISDARFVGDSQVVSRDYMTVKLWDLR